MLTFGDILDLNSIPRAQVRMLRHGGVSFTKEHVLFAKNSNNMSVFEEWQSYQEVKNASRFDAPYWASFIPSDNGHCIFVGLYNNRGKIENSLIENTYNETGDCIADKDCNRYALEHNNLLKDYEGRLTIEWGDAKRVWIQRADRQDKEVISLLTKERHDPPFPGFLEFSESLSELNAVPQSWKDVLSSTRGIYCLSCLKTKKNYIGSAIGANGLMGRWNCYIANQHGGNKLLKEKLVTDVKAGSEVNYRVSVLETFGSSIPDKEILRREGVWKEKFQTRDPNGGYNAN